MSEHTPRPWKVVKPVHGGRYLCVQIGDDAAYTTLELEPSDAYLIAASPDLLSALRIAESALEYVRDGLECRAEQVLEVVRAAIATATETPR